MGFLEVLRSRVEEASKKKRAAQAVRARRAGSDRSELRSVLEQELDRRGVARDRVWVEQELDQLERSEAQRAQHEERQRTAALQALGRFAGTVQRERRVKGDGVVPSALRALTKAGEQPEWMSIPGGTLFPTVSRADGQERAVRLDAAAGPVLERAFTSTARPSGGSRAVFQVWFGPAENGAELVAVHIGGACVGTLDKDASKRVRAVMKSGERRGLTQPRAVGMATLARANDLRPPYVLVVPIR
jgi:hypothetical protein